MSSRKTPPLKALRAFEAAGRHNSFAKAAHELNVTQAAVSHQVKLLEQHLGLPLFTRKPQGLMLTDAGLNYLPGITQAFETITTSTVGLDNARDFQHLTIRLASSIASQWLVPSLNEFCNLNPNVNLRISAQDNDPRFFPEEVDLEIRHGTDCPAGMDGFLLLKERITPVCSPRLIHGDRKIRKPEDLLRHTLLHINYYPEDWKQWFTLAGLPEANCNHGHRFDQSVLTMQAAIHGLGVALGRSPIVSKAIMSGALIAPFNEHCMSDGGYWVAYPATRPLSRTASRFIYWLKQQSNYDD